MGVGSDWSFVLPQVPDVRSPTTLAWSAVLLLLPLFILAFGWPLVTREFSRRIGRLSKWSRTDYSAFRSVLALRHAGYRAGVGGLIYAVLLLTVCAAIVWRGGTQGYSRGTTIFVVDVEPGLHAASAILLYPGIALTVGAVVAVVFAGKWSAALRTTPLVPILWLLGVAAGLCGATIFMSPFLSIGLPIATVYALVALAWLTAPTAEGPTWQQVRRAVGEGQSEFARGALGAGPSIGECRVLEKRGLARWFESWFFVPRTVLERLRWDEDGLEADWLDGTSNRYGWEQVESISVTEHIEGQRGSTIRLSAGAELVVPEGGPEYRALVSAVQSHVWARNQRERE